jgi:hypothetical protein
MHHGVVLIINVKEDNNTVTCQNKFNIPVASTLMGQVNVTTKVPVILIQSHLIKLENGMRNPPILPTDVVGLKSVAPNVVFLHHGVVLIINVYKKLFKAYLQIMIYKYARK